MPSRRHFLLVSAGLGGAIGLGLTEHFLLRGGRSGLNGRSGSLQVANRTSWAMGTDVSMTALHADHDVAAQALDNAFSELERIEALMSIYRDDSQLSQLNRDGKLNDPHPYFVEVLQAACEMSQRSEGAFDITVQPLWSVFSTAKKKGTLPEDDAIAQARQTVDWRRVQISSKRIELKGEGTAITLNGIAQGFAADKATAAMRALGIEHALINTGEANALGTKANGEPWSIGIQHPRHPDAYVLLAKLAGRCLATSGDYATTFSDDFRFHHLFDPSTGLSPTEFSSVSVAAPTAMLADAVSTAVFVLGPERGERLIRSMPGVDAFFVMKDGRSRATEGFLA